MVRIAVHVVANASTKPLGNAPDLSCPTNETNALSPGADSHIQGRATTASKLIPTMASSTAFLRVTLEVWIFSVARGKRLQTGHHRSASLYRFPVLFQDRSP